LGAKNIISFVPLYWKYPDLFLPHYAYDLPHKVIEAAATIKKSRRYSMIQYLKANILGKFTGGSIRRSLQSLRKPAMRYIFHPSLFHLKKMNIL